MPAPVMRLLSPAKINLWLKVLGRRNNGYHQLETLMCPISLYDELELELNPQSGLSLKVSDTLGQGIPANGDNLALRAAALFFARIGRSPGARIKLVKHIPAGSGLGGGSGNAAAVFYGLNLLMGSPLTKCQLAELALKTGADTPFFLGLGPAVAQGVGELLTPVTLQNPPAAVVIYPGVMVSTAKIYQNFKLPLTNAPKHSICLCAESNAELRLCDFELKNDLEDTALSLFPEIGAAKQALTALGLKPVLMSGSGSAVFGLCPNLATAQRLVAGLKIKSGWRVFTVEILNKFGIVL